MLNSFLFLKLCFCLACLAEARNRYYFSSDVCIGFDIGGINFCGKVEFNRNAQAGKTPFSLRILAKRYSDEKFMIVLGYSFTRICSKLFYPVYMAKRKYCCLMQSVSF